MSAASNFTEASPSPCSTFQISGLCESLTTKDLILVAGRLHRHLKDEIATNKPSWRHESCYFLQSDLLFMCDSVSPIPVVCIEMDHWSHQNGNSNTGLFASRPVFLSHERLNEWASFSLVLFKAGYRVAKLQSASTFRDITLIFSLRWLKYSMNSRV